MVYEVETSDLFGGAQVEDLDDFPDASGDGHVGYMEDERSGFTIPNLAAANTMVLRYAAQYDGQYSILINDEFRQHFEFNSTGSYSDYEEMIIYLNINQGDSITFIHQSGTGMRRLP